jgi:transcriptional regulator with XRE-family HTH domain
MAQMNDVQARIAELEAKGWTLASIADELHIAHNTVESWKAGDRHTHFEKLVLDALDELLKRKRIPQKRRNPKGKHRQRNISRKCL